MDQMGWSSVRPRLSYPFPASSPMRMVSIAAASSGGRDPSPLRYDTVLFGPYSTPGNISTSTTASVPVAGSAGDTLDICKRGANAAEGHVRSRVHSHPRSCDEPPSPRLFRKASLSLSLSLSLNQRWTDRTYVWDVVYRYSVKRASYARANQHAKRVTGRPCRGGHLDDDVKRRTRVLPPLSFPKYSLGHPRLTSQPPRGYRRRRRRRSGGGIVLIAAAAAAAGVEGEVIGDWFDGIHGEHLHVKVQDIFRRDAAGRRQPTRKVVHSFHIHFIRSGRPVDCSLTVLAPE